MFQIRVNINFVGRCNFTHRVIPQQVRTAHYPSFGERTRTFVQSITLTSPGLVHARYVHVID